MTWKVRHEGSPQPVETTFEQLVQQLADGRWEPTDEVMGPEDVEWVAIENHPALEEIAAELEAPPAKHYDDETRLDMTALIDVTLVLLVFFILTTTVAAMQNRMEAPTADKNKPGARVVKKEDVAKTMIHVKVKVENGEPVIRVEDEVVPLERLMSRLKALVGSTRKSKLLLEHDDEVTQDIVVKVIDAAKGARVTSVNQLVP